MFRIANLAPMPGWLLISFFPKWKYTPYVVCYGIMGVLALFYSFLIVRYAGESDGSFGSLQGVMALFDSPYAVLAGWVHYLAFDLFVGLCIVRDASKFSINHYFLVVPCLFLTLMFGPVGFLMYQIIKFLKTKSLTPPFTNL